MLSGSCCEKLYRSHRYMCTTIIKTLRGSGWCKKCRNSSNWWHSIFLIQLLSISYCCCSLYRQPNLFKTLFTIYLAIFFFFLSFFLFFFSKNTNLILHKFFFLLFLFLSHSLSLPFPFLSSFPPPPSSIHPCSLTRPRSSSRAPSARSTAASAT